VLLACGPSTCICFRISVTYGTCINSNHLVYTELPMWVKECLYKCTTSLECQPSSSACENWGRWYLNLEVNINVEVKDYSKYYSVIIQLWSGVVIIDYDVLRDRRLTGCWNRPRFLASWSSGVCAYLQISDNPGAWDYFGLWPKLQIFFVTSSYCVGCFLVGDSCPFSTLNLNSKKTLTYTSVELVHHDNSYLVIIIVFLVLVLEGFGFLALHSCLTIPIICSGCGKLPMMRSTTAHATSS